MRIAVSPHEQVDALTGAVEDLAGQFSLEPLLHRILRRAVSLLGGGAGSISTVDEKAGTYHKQVDLGVGCQVGKVFSLREGATGAVVAKRAPVVFDSYRDVPGGHVAPEDRERLHATIAVPIEWAGEIIGACVVFSTEQGVRFGPEDARLLGLFAKHAAIAIINARLHAEAAQRTRRVAVSAERERVVRDVHDTVARALGTILLHLDAAEAEGLDAASSVHHLTQARQAAGAALSETRRTVLGLGPALLELHSLDEAVALELAWARSTTGIRSDLVVTGEPPLMDPQDGAEVGSGVGDGGETGIDPEVGQQALRLVQEALTNVVTHAKAALVRVGVMYAAAGVTVVVEDDGVGFDPAELAERRLPARGLHGIVARARRLGGDVQIESTPGWGTRVRARLPYQLTDQSSTGVDRPLWRVLVVDPRPVVRAGLVRLLAQAEPEIQVVGEIAVAGEVVDAVRVLEPDVVLLHLHMPELDGARLTSYIRAASPGASVLVMTDDHIDELLRDAVHAGARGCIGADLDGPALARAVLGAARGDVLLTDTVLSGFVRGHRLPDGVALTAREHEVRGLVERGLRDKQIATELGISVKTVEKHVGAVLRKTGSSNRTALAHRAALR
ncbi:MAG TPA: response regulator [Pseudonocardia sp.]|jgi:DNA-binding NarL/FixJ family response regulator/signal transduction histidine kinase|nr:response regulator [Pseudonocardia sp.]